MRFYIKYIGSTILPAFLVSLLIVFLSYYVTYEKTIEQNNQTMKAEVSLLAEKIEFFFQNNVSQLYGVSLDFVQENKKLLNKNIEFDSIHLSGNVNFEQFFYVDKNKKYYSSKDITVDTAKYLYNLNESYVTKISSFLIDSQTSRKYVLVCNPIFIDSEFNGSFCGLIFVDRLLNYLFPMIDNPSGNFILFDSMNHFFSQKEVSFSFIEEVKIARSNLKNDYFVYNDQSKLKYYAYQKYISINQWTILLIHSEREFLSTIHVSTRTLFALTIFCFLILILFSIIYSVYMLKPLLEIRENINKVAKGEINVRVTQLPYDEVGDIGRSLNEMAEQLIERTRLSQELNRNLATSEKERREILENMQDTFYRTNVRGSLIEISKSIESLIGYEIDEMVGQNLSTFYWDPQIRFSFLKLLKENKGKLREYDICLRHKNGREVWVITSAQYYYNQSGQIIGIEGVARDNTERRNTIQLLQESEDRLQILIRYSSDIFVLVNENCIQYFITPIAYKLTGYTFEELRGSIERVIHPDDLEKFYNSWTEMLSAPNNVVRIEYRHIHLTKEYIWVEAVCQNYLDEPTVRSVVMNIRDISERKQTEELMKEAQTVFESSAEAIMVTDSNGIIKIVNPAFVKTTGYELNEIIGQKTSILRSGVHDDNFYRQLWHDLIHVGKWEGEVWNRKKDGQIFPEWQSITAVYDNFGKIIEYISQFVDITKRKRDEEEIYYRANYDLLTELPNRNLLIERMNLAFREAKQDESILAVLFIDLDHFKEVNDTLGHLYGDELLKKTSIRLKNIISEEDTVARQGGDEFVIILKNIQYESDAENIAKKIIQSISEPFELDGNNVLIGASIGITIYPKDGTDVLTLFRNADLAMYSAKLAGRNNYQYYNQILAHSAIEKNQIIADLRNAKKNQELSIYYQPIVDCETLKIVGAEALLRWKQKDKGFISTEKFIPYAEESGLIIEIGNWVIENACIQFNQWQKIGIQVPISVNISSRQIPESLKIDWIIEILDRYQVPVDMIHFEITESVLLEDSYKTWKWLDSVKQLGIKLVLDDFGTGYSSLAYLKKVPVQRIKIDRTFIKDITLNYNDQVLVQAIIAISNSLNIEVLAEGVETKEQFQLLQKIGCQMIQGFYFAKPKTPEEFVELISSHDPSQYYKMDDP